VWAGMLLFWVEAAGWPLWESGVAVAVGRDWSLIWVDVVGWLVWGSLVGVWLE
jgi:hypothetical protein